MIMKRVLFLTVFCLDVITSVYSQQANYTVDNGYIVVTKVVENIPANSSEIYARAKNYFSRVYRDANSVIQADDPANGLVIGKGLYKGIETFDMGRSGIDGFHTLRIDIKDGRARIICSADRLTLNYEGKYKNQSNVDYFIVDYVPITDKSPGLWTMGISKEKTIKAFYSLVSRMNASVNECAQALLEGGLLNSEKEDW
jgi:hypothetical protein